MKVVYLVLLFSVSCVFRVFSFTPTPVLHAPLEGATNVQVSHIVAINDMSGISKIEFEYDTDQNFGNTTGDNYINNVTNWGSGYVNDIYSDYFTKSSTGIKFGLTYYLRVRVYDNSDVASAWSNVRMFTTVAAPVLTAPQNSATDVQVSHGVVIDDMSGISKIEFEYDTDENFGNATGDNYINNVTNWNSGYISDIYSDYFTKSSNGIKFGLTYYLRVRAYNASNVPSAWSNVRTFTTIAAPVLTAPQNSATNVQVSHGVVIDDMSGISKIEFEYDTDENFGNATGDNYINNVTNWNSGYISDIYSDYFTKSSAGIKFGLTYYMRVRVYNASDVPSAWSNVRTFTTIAAPVLTAPQNSATNVQVSHGVVIEDMSGISKIEFEYDTDENFGNATGDNYINNVTNWNSGYISDIYSDYFTKSSNGIKFGLMYYLRVRVYNASDVPSAWSNVRTFTTIAAPVLHVPLSSSTNVQVSHTVGIEDMSGISKIEYEYDTDQNFANTTGDRYMNNTTNWNSGYIDNIYDDYFTAGGLKFGKDYYLRVRAYNANDIPSGWSNIRAFTTVAMPSLTAPAQGATNVSAAGTTLSWTDLSGESGYEVQLSTTNLFTTQVFSVNQTAASKSTGALVANTTYYWRVRAKIEISGVTYYSAWSQRSFSTGASIAALPATPLLESPVDNAVGRPTSVNLNWSDVSGADYIYEYSTDRFFITNVSTGNVSSGTSQASINSLVVNTKYYWRVRSIVGDLASDWTSVYLFTTGPTDVIAVTVEISDNSTTYNGSTKTVSVTTNPQDVGHTVAYSQNGQNVPNPVQSGVYEVVVTLTEVGYEINGQSTGTLTINKATLAVTADSKSKTYGAVNPSFTLQYSGFANGEDASVLTSLPTASTQATQYSNVGTYPITPSEGSATNYAFSYFQGELTIDKAPLTVTADAKAKVYGQANPALTYQYDGFVGSDDASVLISLPLISTSATQYENTGVYPIILSGGEALNYNLTHVPAQLTINKASLTATADAKEKVYGQANPLLTFQYTGFLGADNETVIDTPPAISTPATQMSNVGEYAIEIEGGTDNNYTIIGNNALLTITKASQEITFNPLSTVDVTAEDFNITATASSQLLVTFQSSNEAVATVSGNTVSVHGVGTTEITATQSGSGNYQAANPVMRVLVVTEKQTQTITFEPISDVNFDEPSIMFSLTATTNGMLPVTFSTNSSDVISIAGSTVTVLSPGAAAVTARQGGNDDYYAAQPVVREFCVNPPKPLITLEEGGSSSPMLISNAPNNQWFKDGALISGATATTLEVTTPGVYEVRTSVDNCSRASDPFSIIVTGVESLENQVVVYPNPTTDQLTIEFKTNQLPATITLSNSSGAKMIVQKIKSQKTNVSLQHLMPGLYLLTVEKQGSTEVIKVVKK